MKVNYAKIFPEKLKFWVITEKTAKAGLIHVILEYSV
jgi:hypothetical protein